MKNIVDKINERFFDNTGVTSAVNDKKKAQALEKVLLKTFVPRFKEHVGTKGWYPIKPLTVNENKSFCKYLSENFNQYEGFELDIIIPNEKTGEDEISHCKFTKAYKHANAWNVYDKYGWNVYEDYGLKINLEAGPIVAGSVKLTKDED